MEYIQYAHDFILLEAILTPLQHEYLILFFSYPWSLEWRLFIWLTTKEGHKQGGYYIGGDSIMCGPIFIEKVMNLYKTSKTSDQDENSGHICTWSKHTQTKISDFFREGTGKSWSTTEMALFDFVFYDVYHIIHLAISLLVCMAFRHGVVIRQLSRPHNLFKYFIFSRYVL